MADGYSRVSGKQGVCIGQNGPGISNCVTGIAAAFWAHSPVVIVTPETGTMGIGLGGFQEASQLPMFQEFTKYQVHLNNSNRMAEFTSRCFDRALSEMGPTQIYIPRDLFYGEIDVLHQRIRPLIQQTIDARFTAPEKPQPWDVEQPVENEAAWAAKAPEHHWRYRRR